MAAAGNNSAGGQLSMELMRQKQLYDELVKKTQLLHQLQSSVSIFRSHFRCTHVHCLKHCDLFIIWHRLLEVSLALNTTLTLLREWTILLPWNNKYCACISILEAACEAYQQWREGMFNCNFVYLSFYPSISCYCVIWWPLTVL